MAQVALQGQNVIEAVLAGHYNARVLAAVAVGANLSSLPMMAMIGTMYAVPASISQLAGAGRFGEIAPLFRQAVWLALGVGLVMMAAVGLVAPLLVRLAGIDASLEGDATAFLHAICLAMPAIGLYVACRGLSDGLSMPGPSLAFSLGGLLILLPLGWVLMFGKFGVPALGAAGTGLSGAIADWLLAAGFLAFLRFSPRYRHIGWHRGRVRPDWRVIGGLLRIGVPMGVSIVSEVGLFSVAALCVGRFGVDAAASHQVALNVAGLAFMVPLGLSSAITVRVGIRAGAGDEAGARRAGLLGCAIALAMQTLPFLVMSLAPRTVASLYTDDLGVIAGGAVLLRIAAVFQFSDGLQVACNGALRGLKDTRAPMLLTAVSYWGVGLPVGLLLGFGAGLGAAGVWAGLTAGLSAAAILLLARFLRRTRHRHPVGTG